MKSWRYERLRALRCTRYEDAAIHELVWRASGRRYCGVVQDAAINLPSQPLLLSLLLYILRGFTKNRGNSVPWFSPCSSQKSLSEMPCFGLPQNHHKDARCLFPPFCRTQNVVQGTSMTGLPAKNYQIDLLEKG